MTQTTHILLRCGNAMNLRNTPLKYISLNVQNTIYFSRQKQELHQKRHNRFHSLNLIENSLSWFRVFVLFALK